MPEKATSKFVRTSGSYVVLYLLILSPLITRSTEICGTPFTDLTSSCFLAEVVLSGTFFKEEDSELFNSSDNYAIIFHVEHILKGQPLLEDFESIKIETFSRVKERSDACIFEEVTLEKRYLMFIKKTSINKNTFQLSAFPKEMGGKTMKEINANICAEDGFPPSARIKSKTTEVNLGARGKLECEVSGVPPPLITWLHNNAPINDSNVLVKNKKFVSRLEIKGQETNSGVFTCVARNIFGEDNSSAEIRVTLSVDHTAPCPKKGNGFCLNGGECRMVIYTNEKVCRCKQTYHGTRCQEFHSAEVQESTITYAEVCKALTIVSSIILLVVLVVVVFVIFSNRRKQLQSKSQGLLRPPAGAKDLQ